MSNFRDDEGPTRRQVMVAGLGVLLSSACGNEANTGDATDGSEDEGESQGEAGTGESGDGDGDGDGDCTPTAPDIEGPFYRPDIPIGGDLDVHGDQGSALVFGGTVSDSSCAPVENAIVEIWHASPLAPGGEPGDLDAIYDNSDAYRYYGQVATDAQGRFVFNTLKPGWYLNGAAYRPAHLHLKVWVGGNERLTTQVYFVGDPFNGADAWFNPDLAIDPDGAGMASLDFVV